MSYILSSFYYSALENAVLRQIVFESPLRVIMRMTDDYIMITDCVEDAYRFLRALVQLSTSGLIKFNKKKLKANFPINTKEVVLDGTQLIQTSMEAKRKHVDYCQWVGIEIDMKTMEIMPHYNCSMDNVGISININIPSKRPKLWLCRKMNWYSRLPPEL